jgi:4'-phosphopantetheinyl transferase
VTRAVEGGGPRDTNVQASAPHKARWECFFASRCWTGFGVDVWTVELAVPPSRLLELWRFLSLSERSRAGQFVFEMDRLRFVAAHGLVRLVLASYLGCPPDVLEFVAGPGGKPLLEGPGGGLKFNLSHSAELGLVAVARDREVGVDVEKVRRIDALNSLARLCLSQLEASCIARLPQHKRLAAFFACWTRREAVLKGIGTGLSGLMECDPARFHPDDDGRWCFVGSDATGSRDWLLVPLYPAPGFVGTIAVESAPGQRRSRS